MGPCLTSNTLFVTISLMLTVPKQSLFIFSTMKLLLREKVILELLLLKVISALLLKEVDRVQLVGTHLMDGDQTLDPQAVIHSMAEDQTLVTAEVVQAVQIMLE